MTIREPTEGMIERGVAAIRACKFHETSEAKMAAEVWRAMQSSSLLIRGGGEDQGISDAAAALIADVRRRYPGEELRCPLMQNLDAALAKRRDA